MPGEQLERIPAGAEMLEREPKTEFAQALRKLRGLAHVLGRNLFGDLKTQPLGLDFQGSQLRLEPAHHALVEDRVLGEAHENAGGLAVRRERHGGADDPSIDVLHQIVALGRADELRRQHLAALLVEHAHQHVEHALVLAEQARDRLLYQPEPILHERALDVLHPDLVVSLHPRVGVGLVDRVHLVAAELASAPRRADRVGDRRTDVGIGRRQEPQAHRDRHHEVFLVETEAVIADARDDVLRPGLDIARRAALEQDQEAVAAEASAEVVGGELEAQRLGELADEVLAREHADGGLDLGEAVGLHVGELAHAAFHGVGAALLDGGEQVTLLQEAGRGIVLHRMRELQLEVVIGALVVRRDADARRRLVLVVRARQGQRQRHARAVREQRLHLERVIGPLALQAGDQRALERGMSLGLEQIHQRRAGERIVARVAEELEPGAIGVDDDAFLNVCDRIGRAFEEALQLLAILARRGQGRGQRPLQAVRAQLAAHHRLQAAAVGERHHVLGARAHRLGDDRLVDLIAHDHDRHLRCALLLDLDERAQVDAELVDEGDQQLGIELRDGIRQVARVRQPRAVHRMAGIAQRAVDGLDVVLRPSHDDQWNRALFAHVQIPRQISARV